MKKEILMMWFGMALYLCLFGKRPYQKALVVTGFAVLGVIIALIMTAVMRFFF